MATPTDLESVARALAEEAGHLIVSGRSAAHIAATKSSAADVVTQMDLAAERLLRERLATLRPDDGILGEEGDDVSGSSGITWVLDPIDGTVNYLYGIEHYAVSVAAVSGPPRPREWTALAGAIYDGSGQLWSARAGGGATRGTQRLVRGDGPPLSTALVATGFQYVAQRRAIQGDIVARMLPQVRDIRRLGAASIDLVHVAAGLVDGYYEHGLQPWDFAAASLIAQEAGVRVASIDGGPPSQESTIAAPHNLWDELRDALVQAGGSDPFATREA